MIYYFNFSAYIRLFVEAFTGTNLNISNELNFSDVYGSVFLFFKIQSTLVISKSKGPSKTLRDIRTSTYQICSIEEKTI